MITPGEAKISFSWLIQNTIQTSQKDLTELLVFFRVLSNSDAINHDKLEYLLDYYSLPETNQKDIFVLESYKKFISKQPEEKENYLNNLSKILDYTNDNPLENKQLLALFRAEIPNLKYEKDEMDSIIKDKLENLIGLQNVKAEIKNLQNLALINKKRKMNGLKTNSIAMHMVFQGPPGTGKTTIARIIGEIYYALGIISRKEVLEVAREDLVAEYLGQSEIKTKKVLEMAKGGVLFIDEAYSLSDSEDDYGKSVINTLLKFMEDHRDDTLIIIAGYTDEMTKFLKSNPGLESRFNTILPFPNYTTDELIEILKKRIKSSDYQIAEENLLVIKEMISKIKKEEKTFSNGRYIRNMLEKAMKRQASRLIEIDCPTKKDLMTLKIEDFRD